MLLVWGGEVWRACEICHVDFMVSSPLGVLCKKVTGLSPNHREVHGPFLLGAEETQCRNFCFMKLYAQKNLPTGTKKTLSYQSFFPSAQEAQSKIQKQIRKKSTVLVCSPKCVAIFLQPRIPCLVHALEWQHWRKLLASKTADKNPLSLANICLQKTPFQLTGYRSLVLLAVSQSQIRCFIHWSTLHASIHKTNLVAGSTCCWMVLKFPNKNSGLGPGTPISWKVLWTAFLSLEMFRKSFNWLQIVCWTESYLRSVTCASTGSRLAAKFSCVCSPYPFDDDDHQQSENDSSDHFVMRLNSVDLQKWKTGQHGSNVRTVILNGTVNPAHVGENCVYLNVKCNMTYLQQPLHLCNAVRRCVFEVLLSRTSDDSEPPFCSVCLQDHADVIKIQTVLQISCFLHAWVKT